MSGETSEGADDRQALGAASVDAFRALAPALAALLGNERAVPRCRFRLVERAGFDARVRRPGTLASHAIVELAEGLLVELHDTLSRAAPTLARVLGADAPAPLDPDRVLGCLYELSLHFVLLHELYHVHEGHLGWLAESEGLAAFAESTLAAERGLDPDAAYFLELEADGSALVSLITHLEFESVLELLGPADDDAIAAGAITALRGRDRALGYRAVLVALWTTAALMERHRAADPARLAPQGRLLGLVSTLMSWYAELEGLALDARGAIVHRLSDAERARALDFVRSVLAPVAMVLGAFPDREELTILAFFDGPEALGAFFADLEALLADRAPAGEAGRQLVRCERLRLTLEPALARGRLFRAPEGSTEEEGMGTLFEILAEPGADVAPETLEAALAEAIAAADGATLESSSVGPAPGLGGAEIAVSFVVSLAAGLTIEGLKAALAETLRRRRLEATLESTDLDEEA